MNRMIFVNLPTSDLAAAERFYTALGFQLNPGFSDESCRCIVIEENIVVMLLARSRFADFVAQGTDVADTSSAIEVLNCLSAESREAVDALADKALAAGGSKWKDPMTFGDEMYGRSFRDPDGHVWEVTWMDPAAVEARGSVGAAAA